MDYMDKFFSTKRIIVILLVGIGIWFLIPKILGLKDTLQLLDKIKYWAFILALVAEMFFYIGSAIITRTVLRMTGDKLKFFDVLKIAVMDSFSVQFLPLGTFGEAAVDYYFYRAKNVRTSHIVLMFVARTIIVWLAFAFIYLIGVAFSPINSQLGPEKLLIVWLIYFLALIIFFYLIYLYFKKDQLLKKASVFAHFVNRLSPLFKFRKIEMQKIPGLVDKVYEATSILARNRRLQISAALGALFFWGGDIFCLYFAFLGFGYRPALAMVIFTYAIARILATISFIPGGVGITEASMSLIFIGFGVPAPTALAATLIFRFLTFWLPIPIGFFSFLSLQKEYIKMKLREITNGG